MNYLQLKDDSTFAQEEAVLAEYFGEGNYVPFHAKEILQRRIKLRLGDGLTGLPKRGIKTWKIFPTRHEPS